jgi:short-subunit dehydrogenase
MHVVVTGASSGIGEAIVREYVRRGAAVTMVARRAELLERIASEAGGKTHRVAHDLGDVEHACDWIPSAEEALGPIDVLVNNAGVQVIGPAAGIAWAKGEALLRLNVLAPLRLTQAVLPSMIARGRGCIVDIASVAALAPTPGMFFYNASKAALAAASEGLRGEIRKTGVHVVTVYPGPVRTPMEKAAREALGHTAAVERAPTGDANVLAALIADAVERRRARIIYPRFYALSRWFPNVARWAVDRFAPTPKQLPE